MPSCMGEFVKQHSVEFTLTEQPIDAGRKQDTRLKDSSDCGIGSLASKLTGMPSVTKSEVVILAHTGRRFASRRSWRMREINRRNIDRAPAIHMTPGITAVRPRVMFHMRSPMTPAV